MKRMAYNNINWDKSDVRKLLFKVLKNSVVAGSINQQFVDSFLDSVQGFISDKLFVLLKFFSFLVDSSLGVVMRRYGSERIDWIGQLLDFRVLFDLHFSFWWLQRFVEVLFSLVQDQLSSSLLLELGIFAHQELVVVGKHMFGLDFGPDDLSSELQIGFIFAVLDQRIPLIF